MAVDERREDSRGDLSSRRVPHLRPWGGLPCLVYPCQLEFDWTSLTLLYGASTIIEFTERPAWYQLLEVPATKTALACSPR